mmetsp:Transcript_42284/g.73467  ORF Transcript_42284/g.73467 Transcript_42284/m.73467 type:complete len:201 (+) Transcript_42284:158-760(+)
MLGSGTAATVTGRKKVDHNATAVRFGHGMATMVARKGTPSHGSALNAGVRTASSEPSLGEHSLLTGSKPFLRPSLITDPSSSQLAKPSGRHSNSRSSRCDDRQSPQRSRASRLTNAIAARSTAGRAESPTKANTVVDIATSPSTDSPNAVAARIALGTAKKAGRAREGGGFGFAEGAGARTLDLSILLVWRHGKSGFGPG